MIFIRNDLAAMPNVYLGMIGMAGWPPLSTTMPSAGLYHSMQNKQENEHRCQYCNRLYAIGQQQCNGCGAPF